VARRVLIADANDLFRDTLCQMLRSTEEGYTIAGDVRTGVEAIAETARLVPDLIILELQFPQLSGFDVMAAVRQNQPGVNILVLTLRCNAASLKRSLQAGANGYCTKTSGRATILEAVAKVAAGGAYTSPDMRAIVRGDAPNL
jgi:two-component system, NarL family, response regulator DegU